MNTLKPYKNYKPSNIAWLGDIPEHWEVIKLTGMCSFVRGNSSFKKDELLSEGKYVALQYGKTYKVNEVDKKFQFYVNDEFYKVSQIVNYGEVIFISTSETIEDLGHSVFYNRNDLGLLGGEQMLLKPKRDLVNGKYLYYSSKIFAKELKKYATGVKVFRFNISDLKTIYTTISPIEEQTTIANFLDYKLSKIDRFIQKKKQLIKLLNEQKAGIINDAVTKGLNPNAKMKPSNIEWLGDIPEHWDSVRTKNVFKLVTEVAPPNNTEVLLSIYTQYGVKPRTEFEARGNRATTTDNYWIVKKQDIIVNKLLAWMGAIGISEYDGVTSPAYDILRSKGKADPYFYHYLFRSPIAFTEFKRHSRGIMDVRLRLYFSEFGDIKLPVPPLDEQKAIVQHIEQETAQINTVIKTIEKEIVLTQEYRVALIAEAVTGKIDVRDFEIPETPIVELYEELEEEMSLAAEEEIEYLTEN